MSAISYCSVEKHTTSLPYLIRKADQAYIAIHSAHDREEIAGISLAKMSICITDAVTKATEHEAPLFLHEMEV